MAIYKERRPGGNLLPGGALRMSAELTVGRRARQTEGHTKSQVEEGSSGPIVTRSCTVGGHRYV